MLVSGTLGAAHEHVTSSSRDTVPPNAGSTISISNPVPGFQNSLLGLDASTHFFASALDDWQPLHKADVWVFFVADLAEIAISGYHPSDSEVILSNDITALYAKAQIVVSDPRPRSVQVYMFFVSKVAQLYDHDIQMVACHTAARVYVDQLKGKKRHLATHLNSCKSRYTVQ